MWIKRILIALPVVISLFLLQSFFWVPTYQKQGTGNPERLLRYVQSSIGDAQILNPILSADTASSSINNLVFDGLIDLDDHLNYRPRLARSWAQYEVAYLVINPDYTLNGKRIGGADRWPDFLKQSLADQAGWWQNLQSMEVLSGQVVHGVREVIPAQGGAESNEENTASEKIKVSYTLNRPPRLKFTLKRIDQDFFDPIEALLGPKYFDTFPFQRFIQPSNPRYKKSLEELYSDILPLKEHNPVIEFNLRRGVRFHDGHELDSDDILFTYHAIMNPANASPRTSDYEPVKSAETLGRYQIRFIYKRLFSPAINAWFMGILPKHLLNEEKLKEEAMRRNLTGDKLKTFSLRDSEFNQHPVGTGPFVFREWKADQFIRLDRNEAYWAGPPEYHQYVMRIIPDSLTQEMEFYAGAVDNYSVQPHQVIRFKSDPKYQNFSSVGYFFSYIGYNLRNPLFADRRIRRALGMAIDVEKIIKHILYGEGERVTGPYPKITDWYDPAVQTLPYNPKEALKILNDLGWKKNKDGFLEKNGQSFEFNLITNNGNPVRKNIMTIAQNGWRKLGIKCNTQLFEWAVFLKDFINTAKFDALVLGWSMGVDPDLFQIWHSSQTHPKQLNFVGYKEPAADELIIRIRKEYDKKKQVALAHRLHRLIARDQPYTFLYVAKATRLLDKKIVIVERGTDGKETYKKIYPTKDGNISYYFNKWRKLTQVPEVFSSISG